MLLAEVPSRVAELVGPSAVAAFDCTVRSVSRVVFVFLVVFALNVLEKMSA